MENAQEAKRLYLAMGEVRGDSLNLPLPRRLELPVVMDFRRLLLGRIDSIYKTFIEADASVDGFFASSYDYIKQIPNIPKFDEQSIRVGYLVTKHQALKGAIYTVSDPLQKMLADTSLKNNIPVKFFTPPHRVSYIEFCPAEQRASFQLSAYAGGGKNICEGCYIQERTVEKLPPMSREAREYLELDPQKSVRILDIGISVSPLSQIFSGIATPIAADQVDMMTLFIQDESEPLSDMLERHFEFYKHRANVSNAHTGVSDRDLFKERVTNVFSYLTKVLMYLYVDKKSRYTISEASDLRSRIDKVADKKRPKLEKQLNRVYDRIVIGPKSYTPLAQRIQSQDMPKGTKRPHFRSGYFGVRWKGTGQAKVPELVHVDEVIVNEQMLKGENTLNRRDYEIR